MGVSFTRVEYSQDRLEVIQRARKAGVQAIVVTGCTIASAKAARDLCDSVTDYPLFFTAGVHPHNAKDCDDSTLDQLKQLAAHKKCVAVGAVLAPQNGYTAEPLHNPAAFLCTRLASTAAAERDTRHGNMSEGSQSRSASISTNFTSHHYQNRV